jgi:hypothetical protein
MRPFFFGPITFKENIEMPEGTSEGTTGAGTGQGTPAWIAQLPADLRTNESFTSYKTIGDLAKSHLENVDKLKEFDGIKAKLEDSIPKLPDDATDEERNIYYDALGRPENAKDYEFDGEDKNAPEWTNHWKQQFHSMGLTKSQAKTLSAAWNTQMQAMVDAHNASIKKEMAEAETKLRSELGDRFDANVELAKRVYKNHLGAEFDKDFANGSGANRFQMIRFVLKLAALTGEDRSPQAGNSASASSKGAFINYDKSPAPPKK